MQTSKPKKAGRPPSKSENRMRSMRLEDRIWTEVEKLATVERRSVSMQIAVLLDEALTARQKRAK